MPLGTLVFRLIPPLIAAEVIRRLGEGDYVKGDFWNSFDNEIILYTSLVIVGGVLIFRLNIYLIWKLETFIGRDLLRTMFNHYIKLDASFHADSFGGSLVSRANKLVGSYVRLADTIAFQVIPLVTTFLFVIIVMYPRSPMFVWAFLIFAVVFITGTFILSKRVRELASIEAQAENQNTGTLADAVTNVLAIKSFSAFGLEKKHFEKVTDYTRERKLKTMWSVLYRDFFASLITASVQIMALFIAIIAIVNRDADLATVFLMLSYAVYISDYLWQFSSSTLRNFNRSMGDASEAVMTLNTVPAVKDPAKPEKLSIKTGEVTFKNLIFDHAEERDGQTALFHNLNIHIKPGEKVGLVGHSGGGKTTITKLLLRFMDIDEGKILIDGQDITHITQDDLRSVISYVPQEPLLFHRSLADNISYGKPSASQQEIEKAAKMAHAHEFIKDLPNGYETLVGERGIKLSGGQRQRIAIARAMLKDAPILLLDEATSALDSEAEKLIQEALWRLMKDKTAIVIAHRLSTIQRMDRIIVLENGEIVEEGSHQKLLRSNGIYSELWKHQSGGFLED